MFGNHRLVISAMGPERRPCMDGNTAAVGFRHGKPLGLSIQMKVVEPSGEALESMLLTRGTLQDSPNRVSGRCRSSSMRPSRLGRHSESQIASLKATDETAVELGRTVQGRAGMCGRYGPGLIQHGGKARCIRLVMWKAAVWLATPLCNRSHHSTCRLIDCAQQPDILTESERRGAMSSNGSFLCEWANESSDESFFNGVRNGHMPRLLRNQQEPWIKSVHARWRLPRRAMSRRRVDGCEQLARQTSRWYGCRPVD